MVSEITGEKMACPQRGHRVKASASTAIVDGVKLVGKNFAKPGTRFYGFLGAFIGKAKRVATVQQMIDACQKMSKDLGMPADSEDALKRDLANYISAWLNPTGGRGYHLRVQRVDGTEVSNTDPAAKYELVSVRAESRYADKAKELGSTVA